LILIIYGFLLVLGMVPFGSGDSHQYLRIALGSVMVGYGLLRVRFLLKKLRLESM